MEWIIVWFLVAIFFTPIIAAFLHIGTKSPILEDDDELYNYDLHEDNSI